MTSARRSRRRSMPSWPSGIRSMRSKVIALIIAALIALGTPARAQGTFQLKVTATTPHSVTLFWVASTDAALNPTLGYQIYRLNGVCPVVPPATVAAATGFALISGATPLTVLTYTDLGFPAPPLPP